MKLNLVIGLLATIVLALALYGLDRGIYVGSSLESVGQSGLEKHCRYLFIRGISEVPALGGKIERLPGFERTDEPDHLYCRLIAE
jgi:hypothetical protein